MKIIKGDIFKGQWDAMGHCCNLYHTWGAGIVIPLKKAYPEAYQADLATVKGGKGKLGDFSFADVGEKRIYNLYGQSGIGNDGHPLNRNCCYDLIFDALWCSCRHLTEFPIVKKEGKIIYGLPDMVGCGLAGGSRKIVLAIIEEIEEMFSKIGFSIFSLK